MFHKFAIALLFAVTLNAVTFQTTKDPSSVEDFTIDYATYQSRLSPGNIVTSTWSVPAGITELSNGNTTSRSMIRLSGGTSGTVYTVTNTVTFANSTVLVTALRITVTR